MTFPPHPPPSPPYGTGPSLSPEHIRGLAVGGATLLISGLLLYLSTFGAVAFLLVGALYALLLWRGMPFLADVHTTKSHVRALGGLGTASSPMFPPPQYPSHPQHPQGMPYLPHSVAPTQPIPAQQATAQPSGSETTAMRIFVPETAEGPGDRPAYTEAIAEDPQTSAIDLNTIAASRPDLHPALARNPATYPDLLAWLEELDDPAVTAELAKRCDRR